MHKTYVKDSHQIFQWLLIQNIQSMENIYFLLFAYLYTQYFKKYVLLSFKKVLINQCKLLSFNDVFDKF